MLSIKKLVSFGHESGKVPRDINALFGKMSTHSPLKSENEKQKKIEELNTPIYNPLMTNQQEDMSSRYAASTPIGSSALHMVRQKSMSKRMSMLPKELVDETLADITINDSGTGEGGPSSGTE